MTRRRKVSKDANHDSIADTLRKIGATVIDMASLGNGISDLLAVNRQHAVLLEVKVAEGRFDLHQLVYLAEFKGYSAFCSSEEEAVKIFRAPQEYALSDKQKLLILKLVAKYNHEFDLKERNRGKKFDRRRISVAQFEADFESALI